MPIIPPRLPLTPSPPPTGQFIAAAPLGGAVVVAGGAAAPNGPAPSPIAQVPGARYGFLGASYLSEYQFCEFCICFTLLKTR